MDYLKSNLIISEAGIDNMYKTIHTENSDSKTVNKSYKIIALKWSMKL